MAGRPHERRSEELRETGARQAVVSMKVHIETDDQDEDGVRICVGQTTIVTVWDALSPVTEEEIAELIADFLRAKKVRK